MMRQIFTPKSGFSPGKHLTDLNKLTFLRYQLVPVREISLIFEVQGENKNTKTFLEIIVDNIYKKDNDRATILKNMGFTEPEMTYFIEEDMLQLDNTGIWQKIMKFLETQQGVPFLAKLVYQNVDENNDGSWWLQVETLRPLDPNR
ncbi:hypothetical protein VB620_04955 [Nodularia harveyana UHCC-0300]|uniref:Uncharacterized protein n=1 Tax=Nodularia harveyana UHCC-0300 TaxID=2974287 RepID=A0ABU5UC09_9CYAN|nr:hypothetical protein [Nodularia harveyana]MEA5580689.1 hypothetical protein [Nodularia harveyana UHCC-0300]